jgi:hypothetical protein
MHMATNDSVGKSKVADWRLTACSIRAPTSPSGTRIAPDRGGKMTPWP